MRGKRSGGKGAVTVMVTLLLIPAILITGTGVDLARIYSARSVVQDANQLACNSALASYDALLQDLYGLYGLMESDSDFAKMIDDYLKATIYAEDWKEDGLGSFQLFYGSELTTTGVQKAEGKNLKNPDVLRRQIEEYCKLRAPIIVVQNILDKLDTFEKVKEDAKVIKKKMKVDDQVEDVDKAYRNVFDCIQKINICEGAQRSMASQLNGYLYEIHGEFKRMKQLREDYKRTDDLRKMAESDAERMEELGDFESAARYRTQAEEYRRECEKIEGEYHGRFNNIRSYIEGGRIYAYSDYEVVTSTYRSVGLRKWVDTATTDLSNCIDSGSNKSCDGEHLKHLVDLCKTADEKKKELLKRVEDLEAELNRGKCTEEMRSGIADPQPGEDGKLEKSMLDQYRDLCKYDLEPMGRAVYDKDKAQIEAMIDLMENAFVTENSASARWKNVLNLESSMSIINYNVGMSDVLGPIADGAPANYEPVDGGFREFQDTVFNATKNNEFYHILYEMCINRGSKEKKDAAKSNVTQIFKKAQELFKNSLTWTVEGAEKLQNAEDHSDSNTGSGFGSEGDWSKENEGKKQLEKSLDGDFLSKLTNAAGELGNQAILMVYATEMFSDYSSPRVVSKSEKPAKNMAGIPMSPEVNYYYHSELEYIYNGNLSDAKDNLKSVAGMILLVRFIFNYIASFSVSSVRNIVSSIRAVLAGTGPFAILISELARMGMAIGESALDVERLRTGEKVALYKKSDQEWRFSIKGVANWVSKTSMDGLFDTGSDKKNEGDESGLLYTDYLRLFLLLTDGDDIAHRISNLIELNVTNYSQEINADEGKMASATRFDLSKAITDFSVTTEVDLRMLFLSMPFAQKGINGIVPPKTFPIKVTDYRGY